MSVPPMYHVQSRELQDQFDTRRLADRIVEKLVRARFTEENRAFIEKQSMFFLATADAEGYPDCSYKGGAPGFVRMLDETTLAFQATTGTACQESWEPGPSTCGSPVLELRETQRLRVNGTASVNTEDPLLPLVPGARR